MIEQIVTSTVLIMAVLLISVIFEKRIGPCIKYALWLLVAVKLLVPLPMFESSLSVMNLIPQLAERNIQFSTGESVGENDEVNRVHLPNEIPVNVTSTDKMSSDMQSGDEGLTDIKADTAIADAVKESIDSVAVENDFAETEILFVAICRMIWLCGMIICAGIFIRGNIRFSIYLKKERVFVERYRDKLPVYEVEGISSPCLFGLIRPAVYLDKDSMLTEQQRTHILMHEYTHYRHCDHIWSFVRCVCVILYWYNPFVWLAASKSINDGELACDAGTLKRIGIENGVKYGKTLLAIAEKTLKKKQGVPFLVCTTSAAGGMREMKKRMQMIVKRPKTMLITVICLVVLCCGLVGCTFGGAVSEAQSDSEVAAAKELANREALEKEALEKEALEKELQAQMNQAMQEQEEIKKLKESLAQEIAASGENIIYQGVTLYRQREEDKVCLKIAPAGIHNYLNYYYIPTGEVQEKLIDFMENLEENWQEHDRRWEGKKEVGCWIYYKDKEYMMFEDGYLYGVKSDEDKKPVECLVQAEEICSLVQQTLADELDYKPYDITQIKNIVSAKLNVCSVHTDGKVFSQTITDSEKMKLFEDWFSNAEYIYGGADCLNQNACLELTLAGGEVVKLAVATDSCSNFGINGVYYDYRPTAGWSNEEFFNCFDEIFGVETVVREVIAFTENPTQGIWPTDNMAISANFGLQNNGTVSDHINIVGDEGDEIYAVVNGTISEAGYESIMGNYIVLVDENNVSIQYGHLQEIFVEEGQEVAQGDVIATLGKTGTATGPNLSFAVYVDGEAVEPIAEYLYAEAN